MLNAVILNVKLYKIKMKIYYKFYNMFLNNIFQLS